MPDPVFKRIALHVFSETLSVLMLALEAGDYERAKEAADSLTLVNRVNLDIINMLLDHRPSALITKRYRELFRTK